MNPLDRFGDHLRILLRSPAAYQLMIWLTSAPGTPLPGGRAAAPGRWVVCGHGRFGAELSADLRARGWRSPWSMSPAARLAGDGDSATRRRESDHVADAVAFVAATTNDTTNLWLVAAARRANPDLFVVALQNGDERGAVPRRSRSTRAGARRGDRARDLARLATRCSCTSSARCPTRATSGRRGLTARLAGGAVGTRREMWSDQPEEPRERRRYRHTSSEGR